jgi:ribonuclease D
VTRSTTSRYITSHRALNEFCQHLKDSARLALDTEFVGEDSFVPKLELIQVATETSAAVIDFPAVLVGGPLDLFWEIICNPTIEKVIHSGRQDLDLFAFHAGQIPKPFFDAQIAAAMVGYGPQVAYANLVQRVHGARLDKAHTLTNWSARPLSREQLVYALEDVTFLLGIHDHLHACLSKRGRLHWAQEEFSRLEDVVGNARREPQERYQRVRGWNQLKPSSAAVLRQLVVWREREAQRRNVPRGRVLRDEVLLQLARHPPRRLQELRAVRGLHGSEVERSGEALLAAIHEALALPPSAWPEVPKERKTEPESGGLVELLQAVMKARATEEEVAPTLLATTAELEALVDARTNGAFLDLPLLKGWRRLLLGELLLDVLDGKLTVSIDPNSHRVTWFPAPG